MIEFEDKISKIKAGALRADSVLDRKLFYSRRPYAFERFLQGFSEVYSEPHCRKSDLLSLHKFISSIEGVKKLEKTYFELFMLACNSNKLTRDYLTESYGRSINRLIEKIRNQRGCLEYDLERKSSINKASQKVITLPCTSPYLNYTSILSERITKPVESEHFKSKLFHLFMEVSGVKIDFSKDPFQFRYMTNLADIFYELYTNITLHAREELFHLNDDQALKAGPRANFWFLRLERFPISESSNFSRFFPNEIEFKKYSKENSIFEGKPKPVFISISIHDNGFGIFNHYCAKRMLPIGKLSDEDAKDLINSDKSSGDYKDAGLGIPSAVAAVQKLNGIISVRSNGYWFVAHKNTNGLVKCNDDISPSIRGTSYTILIPILKN